MDLLKAPPKLVVGLGNPGNQYKGTRHNIGFMVVDVIAEAAGAKWKTEKKYALAKAGNMLLLKPMTYMNLSGEAVRAIMAKYKLKPGEVLVIHDDLDLPTGSLRAKTGGGNAGHNGLGSIDEAIGKDYARIRIGISHPREEGVPLDPADWVLGKFKPEEVPKLQAAIDQIILAFSDVLQ